MPKMNGIEASVKIKTYNSKIKILILTTFTDKKLILNAFNAPVDGYILKDISSKKLIESIVDCINDCMILPTEIAVKLVEIATEKCSFNETEKEIITCLKEGLSNKEIAQVLNISYGTGRNYLSEIYPKIGADNREKAIEYFLK